LNCLALILEKITDNLAKKNYEFISIPSFGIGVAGR
jgi:ketopantoate hydroxymethyltransferase